MNRIPGLDLLRAIAILWVMMFHALKMDVHVPLELVAKYGWMGVDIFFVLSGYLIGNQVFKQYVQTGQVYFAKFYFSRSLRVLPAFLFVLFVYTAFPMVRESQEIQPVWQFLSFTQNIFIDAEGGKAFSHAWSLCVEEYFYLFFPVIAYFVLRKPSFGKAVFVMVFIVCLGLLLRGLIWHSYVLPVWDVRSGSGNLYQVYIEEIYYPTYTRLDGLCAGVILAMVKVFRPQLWLKICDKSNLLLLIGVLGFALALWLFQDRRNMVPTVLGYPLLSISIACFVAAANEQSVFGRMKIPAAGFVALMAYSLYLTHKSVFHLVKEFGPIEFIPALSVFSLSVFAAFLVALVLYFSIERPFLLLRQKLLKAPDNVLESAEMRKAS